MHGIMGSLEESLNNAKEKLEKIKVGKEEKEDLLVVKYLVNLASKVLKLYEVALVCSECESGYFGKDYKKIIEVFFKTEWKNFKKSFSKIF